MRIFSRAAILAASSVLTMATAAHAQSTTTGQDTATADEDGSEATGQDIVVTARLSAERAIDVPATVTGISSEDLAERNVLKFEDLNSIVPGLNLADGNIATNATVAFRGVKFDASAQTGNTVTAYVNEVPTNLFQLFAALYDVQNFEILRGPQGTLRGQSAPSGAIGLNTRRPDLQEFGGYGSVTATSPRGINVQGAVGGPLIRDVLGLRLAGAFDRGTNGDIRSVNNPTKPFSEGKNLRGTLLFEPTDNLKLTLIYRHDENERLDFGSAVFGNGAPAAAFPAIPGFQPFFSGIPGLVVPAGFNGPVLSERDDRAVQGEPNVLNTNIDDITLQLSWSFAGQNLFYVGNKNWTSIKQAPLSSDIFEVLAGPSRGSFVQDFVYGIDHEIRLSSEEPLFGVVDYTVGYRNGRAKIFAPFTVDNVFALDGAFGSPQAINSPLVFNNDYVIALDFVQDFRTTETGLFANLNFHIGDRTEFSIGGRQISTLIAVASPSATRSTFAAIPFNGPCTGTYSGSTLLGPFTNAPLSSSPYAGTCNVLLTEANGLFASADFPLTERRDKPFVWTASLSHKITPDIMLYANAGTAFRPGPAVVGGPSCDVCATYLFPKTEKSRGIEVGAKGQLFDRRLTFAIAYFRQTFKNFISYGSIIPYVGSCDTASTCSIPATAFAFNAPMLSQGVDAEIDMRVSRNLQLGASLAYARGRYRNATIPCRDTNFDGVPDGGVAPTTLGPWLAAGGPTSGPALCASSGPVSSTPPWNLILRGEYSHEAFANTRAFLRTTFNYTPKNTNNTLANPGFVPKAFGVLDLFTGLESEDGAWEVSLGARNLLNDRNVLSRSTNVGQFGLFPFSLYGLSAGYQPIRRVPERTFQLSVRYAFGSR